ncbi:MAG: large repetitive protein, partial [Actinomycetota bacterium]|nr:large repetitive protein [Actinomycetota bacterium]
FRSTNSAATPMIITGLTNGRLYQVKIRAVNAKGAGLASTTVPVIPTPSVADAPLGVVATPRNGAASIAFRAPLNTGGLPIITYQYSLDNGATWKFRSTNSAATPMIITGLTNGRLYQVRIRAINAKGAGLPSTTVPVTPRA